MQTMAYDIQVCYITGGSGAAGDNVIPGSGANDFTTEYAKSNRSQCRGCDDKIEKVRHLIIFE